MLTVNWLPIVCRNCLTTSKCLCMVFSLRATVVRCHYPFFVSVFLPLGWYTWSNQNKQAPKIRMKRENIKKRKTKENHSGYDFIISQCKCIQRKSCTTNNNNIDCADIFWCEAITNAQMKRFTLQLTTNWLC